MTQEANAIAHRCRKRNLQ